jgi:hypothetical protein
MILRLCQSGVIAYVAPGDGEVNIEVQTPEIIYQ